MPLYDQPIAVHEYGPRKPLDVLPSQVSRRSRVLGAFLGGAVGDALGGPLEFHTRKEIVAEFGAEGVRDFVPLHGTLGAITDDTQLTLFTAEALLRVRVQGHNYQRSYPPLIIRNAYRRWLLTQRHIGPPPEHLDTARGWLLDVPELWVERSPDRTVLTALKRAALGTPEDRINNSRSSMCLVRATPAGMLTNDSPFRLGAEVAAITHGHPTSYVAAGVLAEIVFNLMGGVSIRDAITAATARAQPVLGQREVCEWVWFAVKRADEVRYAGVTPSWYDVERIGSGRSVHEALALGIFCAMCYPEPTTDAFEAALGLAVNHSGDSDTVAALTGQLLGLMHGHEIIPARWLEQLELRDVITRMAEDVAIEHREGAEWKALHPPV